VNWSYHVPYATSDCNVNEDMSEAEIFKQLDKQLNRLMKFEAKIAPRVLNDAKTDESARA
jgi:hypothetical protein